MGQYVRRTWWELVREGAEEVRRRHRVALRPGRLMKRHKSVILLDKPTSHKDNPRASEAEGWDFIENDLNVAISYLPVTRPAAESGCLTKGMALAFKSRVMLYAKRWNKAKTAAGLSSLLLPPTLIMM